jgi:putative endopeptidase
MRIFAGRAALLLLGVAGCGASETKAATAAAPVGTAAHVEPGAGAAPPVPEGVEVASIDPGAKPCDDFFQYACGGWIKANAIPEDQPGWGRFSALSEQNEVALREILERDVRSPDPSEPYAKALGDFYASCMDDKAVEKDDVRPLAGVLQRVDAVKDAASLARATAQLQLVAARELIRFASESDPKDATRVIASIDQRGLALPDRDYYLKDEPRFTEMRAKYQAHAARMLALAGDTAQAAKAGAEGVLRVERALAEASMAREEHRDPDKTYHLVDRAGLQKLAPHFAWDVYLRELGHPAMASFDVAVPGFLAAVDKLALAASTTSGRADLRAYLRVHLLERHASFLSARFVDEAFAFERELVGTTTNFPRWKRCVRRSTARWAWRWHSPSQRPGSAQRGAPRQSGPCGPSRTP